MSVECRDHLECLSDYVDGELDPDLCAEIERHMAECGDCRIVVDTLRKTVSLYRSYGHEELPPDAKERLYAVLRLDRQPAGAAPPANAGAELAAPDLPKTGVLDILEAVQGG